MRELLTLLFLLLAASSCASSRGGLKFHTIENVFYTPEKNERNKGEILVPKGKGPFPGVVLVHGGGWSSRSYEDFRSVARSHASHGFTVFSINYRLAPEHRHPAPIIDLENALVFFRRGAAEYQLDPKRIGLWGYSSGGHTASYYALTRATDAEKKVSAVVSGGAPYDFTWYPYSPYIKGYLGSYRDQMLKEYIEASPVNLITKDAPPFFLYHGLEDRLVEAVQSSNFEAKLKSAGVEARLHTVSFWGHANVFIFSDESVEKGIKFLKEKL